MVVIAHTAPFPIIQRSQLDPLSCALGGVAPIVRDVSIAPGPIINSLADDPARLARVEQVDRRFRPVRCTRCFDLCGLCAVCDLGSGILEKGGAC